MSDHARIDRFVDITSVVLISIAAVLTAVCSYQSGRWSGRESKLYTLSNAGRVEAAVKADRANALTAIDVSLFLQYVEAVNAHDTRLASFIAQRFRPEMRPAMEAWLRAKPLRNALAPSSPFVMPQYHLATEAASHADVRAAAANYDAAQVANQHADDFLLVAVVFAGVSFLGGVSTKMAFPRHAIVVAIGVVGLLYGLVRLFALPLL